MDDLVARTARELKDGPVGLLRKLAARNLGQSGDPRAVEPLLAALGDADLEVVAEVAQALGRLGDLRALEPLEQRLQGEPPPPAVVERAVTAALEALYRVAPAAGTAAAGGPAADPTRGPEGTHRIAIVAADAGAAPASTPSTASVAGAAGGGAGAGASASASAGEAAPAAARAAAGAPRSAAPAPAPTPAQQPPRPAAQPPRASPAGAGPAAPAPAPLRLAERAPVSARLAAGRILPSASSASASSARAPDGAADSGAVEVGPGRDATGRVLDQREAVRAMLVAEALSGLDCKVLASDPRAGYEVEVTVGRRRQRVTVVFDMEDPDGDRFIAIATTAGLAEPDNYYWALRLNLRLAYGKVAVRRIDGADHFVLCQTLLEDYTHPAELRKAIEHAAERGDWIEKQLHGDHDRF